MVLYGAVWGADLLSKAPCDAWQASSTQCGEGCALHRGSREICDPLVMSAPGV